MHTLSLKKEKVLLLKHMQLRMQFTYSVVGCGSFITSPCQVWLMIDTWLSLTKLLQLLPDFLGGLAYLQSHPSNPKHFVAD
jgi:hypothetical protein